MTTAPNLPPRPQATAPTADPVLLRMANIRKTFGEIVANDGVSLELRAGEVHALLGENGAGKSTLMSILYGFYRPDAGTVWMPGAGDVDISSPRRAIALGIGLVPQHFLLVRSHTVAENIALGMKTRFLFPLRQVRGQIRELSRRYGLAVDPDAPVWQLSAGEQQRVEILRVLIRSARVLILDEPTSVLTPQESGELFAIVRRLAAQGHGVFLITHKLDEVMDAADRVTILRKGRVVHSLQKRDTDQPALARLMVGHDVETVRRADTAPAAASDRAPVLCVKDLRCRSHRGTEALRGVSLEVRPGEILGVAGVSGNGQHELVQALTGLRATTGGSVEVGGEDLTGGSARRFFEGGVAHIPEDRLHVGIAPSLSVAENLALKHYRRKPFCRGILLNSRFLRAFARDAIRDYRIAGATPRKPARLLSGGNIQKIILARELHGQPRLIVAAHPTYGLDIGATAQVHRLLLAQRTAGAGLVLVSEDLDEILALSDRVTVLFEGRIVGTFDAADAKREKIGLLMAGHVPGAPDSSVAPDSPVESAAPVAPGVSSAVSLA